MDGIGRGAARDWSILQVYFAITIIISLLGWTELARVVRGRFLALREEDFVVAARLAGCSQMRIIFVHMVPSFMSHIIAATTLALPAMIISETSLSFSGAGPTSRHGGQLGRAAATGPECADRSFFFFFFVVGGGGVGREGGGGGGGGGEGEGGGGRGGKGGGERRVIGVELEV